MKALRIHVERVVRPIRASNRRKDRMREELLAHLVGLFDEERARTGDDLSATAGAIRRFGDATALSRELQDSVPWIERLALTDLAPRGRAKRRVGESPTHYIVRSNSMGLAAGFVVVGLLAVTVVMMQQFRPPRIDAPPVSHVVLFIFGVMVIESVAVMGVALVCERIRQLLEIRATVSTSPARRRLSTRIVGYAVGGAAITAAAFALIMLLFDTTVRIPLVTPTLLLGLPFATAVFTVPALLGQAWSWRAATERFDHWESLDLDDCPTT